MARGFSGTPGDVESGITAGQLADGLATKPGKADLVINVRDYGAKGDGTTNDTSAIAAASAAAGMVGTVHFPAGTYKTTGTVQFLCHVSSSWDAIISYTGPDVAVLIGTDTSGSLLARRRITLPQVVNAAKTVLGWAQTNVAGTAGVKIVNLVRSIVDVPHINNFETGLLVTGNGQGTAYVTFNIGHLGNNKVNEKLTAVNAGWANQNTHLGGSWSHVSNEGLNVAGTKHIWLDDIATNADPNNNTWISPSLESPGVVEYTLDVAGSYNQWINPRFEFTGSHSKVIWRASGIRNWIFGGTDVDALIQTHTTGAFGNSIIGTETANWNPSVSQGIVIENQGSTNNAALTFMRAGGQAAGDVPATAFTSRFQALAWRGKKFNDVNDRVMVDLSNGAIYLGDATAAPTILWTTGTGSPEGVVTAGIGSTYSRKNGSAGTSLYVKESGTGNTGWVSRADRQSFVNVKDYGAKGDGSTDDTAALTAAQVAAAGGQVFLPAGTYIHTGLAVTANLCGAGMTKTTLRGPQMAMSTSDTSLTDLKVLGTTSYAIASAHCARITLRQVQFAHVAGVTNHLASQWYDVDQSRAINCRFEIGGLELSLCDDFLIEGNFWDCQNGNTNEPCHISNQSSGIFTNNIVLNTTTDAVDLYSSGEYCVVSNNRFIGLNGNAGMEIKVTLDDDAPVGSEPGDVIDGVVVSGNVFRSFASTSTGSRAGIYAEYIDRRTVKSFDIATTNRALLIQGNILEDFQESAPATGVISNWIGIEFTGHNGAIRNNIIKNMRSYNGAVHYGMKLSGYTAGPADSIKSVGLSISDNTIVGVDGNGSAAIATGSLTQCQIVNNVVRGDEVAGTTVKWGLDVAAGATLTDCRVTGNTFHCNNTTGYGIRSTGAGSLLVNCQIDGNTFKDCGVQVNLADYCSFSSNILDNALNSTGLSFGVAGTVKSGNKFIGNHFTMSADYALVLTDQAGFIINGNTFKDTSRGILLVGTTSNGIIDGNNSLNQSSGTEFPMYSGVSTANQTTITVGMNRVNGALAAAANTPWAGKADLTISVKDYGAVGDGATDDTAAIRAAFQAANTLRLQTGTYADPGATVRFPRGTYALTTLAAPIDVMCDVDGGGAILVTPASYADTALRVGHTTAGSTMQNMDVVLPSVIGATVAGPAQLPTGGIGVLIRNVYSSSITTGKIAYFETGLRLGGESWGVAYNQIQFRTITFCKVAVALKPLNAGGWVNQNTFTAGSVTGSVAWAGRRAAGLRAVLLDGSGSTSVNGNSFVGCSFESDVFEHVIEFNTAYQNQFYGCRHEQGIAAAAVTISGDTITATGHVMAVGEMLYFSGTTAAAGMSFDNPYYVVESTTNTFKVSVSRGGTPITFTSSGTSVAYTRPQRISYVNAFSNVIDLPMTPAFFLEQAFSGTAATTAGNEIRYAQQKVTDGYAPPDRPVMRVRNRNAGAPGLAYPIVAVYPYTGSPVEQPDSWSTALSVHGPMWKSGTVIREGTGTPEGAITASPGSVFLRSDGTAGLTMYVKESGTSTTGWVAKSGADVQTFTASGTWTKPAGAKSVEAVVVSGGAGGGSGRRGATGTVRCGGGGGAGGGLSMAKVPASTLGATVTVTVGLGGAGGAPVTADDTDGNAGVNGSTSSFGANIRAGTGATTRGAGGTASTGTGGTGSYGTMSGAGTSGGGSASVTGGNGGGGALAVNVCGGGAGGGITSANVAGNGGIGGYSPAVVIGGGATGGGVDAAAPTAGLSQPVGSGLGGLGGGGGAASITQAAQAGGAGGIYGGGGGGGGASVNGFASGAGAAGADGIVIVTTYF